MNVSELRVRVVRKTTEAVDISTFELVNVDARPLPAFSAGSHIDVHLPNGLTRQYSLCNDPSEGHRYLIGVLRDAASRGGSQAMHEQVKEGDVITVLGRTQKNPTVEHAMEEVKGRGIPEWLSFDTNTITGRVNAMPTREQINLPVQEQLIVELYSK